MKQLKYFGIIKDKKSKDLNIFGMGKPIAPTQIPINKNLNIFENKPTYPKYESGKTQAVEIGTGRIAREHNLTTSTAKLEDHYFIQKKTGQPWKDVGIYNASKEPVRTFWDFIRGK